MMRAYDSAQLGQWKQVARVSLSALLSTWLLSALTVLPYLAQAQDFAHQHSDNTPHHIHSLPALLVGLATSPSPSQRPNSHFAPRQQSPAATAERKHPHHPKQSRAPPHAGCIHHCSQGKNTTPLLFLRLFIHA